MIARLRGTVVDRLDEALVLDVHGVGYHVTVPTPLLLDAPTGEELVLQVATVVREDAFLLYGFKTPLERELFGLLRGVSQVGPKVAMGLLSALPPAELCKAITTDDLRALTRAPGVGKKTAERICLELQGRLPAVSGQPSPVLPLPRAQPEDPLPLALARLDYRKSEIDQALSDPHVPGPEAPIGERLSAALRVLARNPA